MIYLIGSLRNPEVPGIARILRDRLGEEIFDDWYAAGPEADDYWRDYEKARGHRFSEALQGYAARNVYNFDKTHLDRCRAAVLLLPAGKSGHLELGYILGAGKPGYILLEPSDPERFDVMYQFATGVYETVEELINGMESSDNIIRQVGNPPAWVPATGSGSTVGVGGAVPLGGSWSTGGGGTTVTTGSFEIPLDYRINPQPTGSWQEYDRLVEESIFRTSPFSAEVTNEDSQSR